MVIFISFGYDELFWGVLRYALPVEVLITVGVFMVVWLDRVNVSLLKGAQFFNQKVNYTNTLVVCKILRNVLEHHYKNNLI